MGVQCSHAEGFLKTAEARSATALVATPHVRGLHATRIGAYCAGHRLRVLLCQHRRTSRHTTMAAWRGSQSQALPYSNSNQQPGRPRVQDTHPTQLNRTGLVRCCPFYGSRMLLHCSSCETRTSAYGRRGKRCVQYRPRRPDRIHTPDDHLVRSHGRAAAKDVVWTTHTQMARHGRTGATSCTPARRRQTPTASRVRTYVRTRLSYATRSRSCLP